MKFSKFVIILAAFILTCAVVWNVSSLFLMEKQLEACQESSLQERSGSNLVESPIPKAIHVAIAELISTLPTSSSHSPTSSLMSQEHVRLSQNTILDSSGDFETLQADDELQCRTLCFQRANCIAWTFYLEEGNCTLKDYVNSTK